MKTVYLIINGSLGMSPGKIAAQSFQACQRLFDNASTVEQHEALSDWRSGTKTVVKIAKTEHLFNRACAELDGAVMIDEGMNEVEPDSATIFATYPLDGEMPRMLKHKGLPLYTGQNADTNLHYRGRKKAPRVHIAD